MDQDFVFTINRKREEEEEEDKNYSKSRKARDFTALQSLIDKMIFMLT